jgi:hypothetical protein
MSSIETTTTRSLPSAPILALTYEPHPLAGLMPMMDEEPFKMFKANIAKEGSSSLSSSTKVWCSMAEIVNAQPASWD